MLNNSPRIRVVFLGVAMLLLMVMIAPTATASPPAKPVVNYATRSDATGPLRDLPQIPPMPAVLGTIFQRPLKVLPNRSGGGASAPDPVVQESVGSVAAASTGANFEGVSNVNGVLPPDTNGDIGPNNYVQIVNLSFAVYDRSGNLQYGPVDTNTLWQGFGGPCQRTNDGDPIVLYDQQAGRWMLSQFALPRYPRGPFYQCIAVSQTPDPLGAWYRYEFQISNSKLNDYPKFGVWPDGYYMSINQFQCNVFGCSWAGQGAVVFERDQMLNGGSARMVYFDLQNTDPNLGGMLPADLDGPPPPAGAPNPYVQVDDDSWGYSPDQLQIWNFHVDWNNPSNSTFLHDVDLGTAAFDSDMCGYSRNCIPQPGGANVDAISDRLMYRLQYRNFGDHQTLVTNQTVDTGVNHAGIRWYELQDNGSGWAIAQQGTYTPDNAQRWMGSVAMNGAGDIALGYSVSSTSISPSIRFTGRLAGDAAGQMTVAEGTIVDGSGYQTHSSGRWGDYSMMAVDPTDDCTFWYTTEYYNGVGSATWQTRVGSFRLSSCGPVDNPPSVTITNPANGATVSSSVNVTADASDDNGVTQVEFFVDGISIGIDSNGGDGWSTSWDTASYSDGSHTVSATATDTASQTGNDSIAVSVDNTTPVGVTVTSISPDTLTAGGSVNGTITGSGFMDGASVSFENGTGPAPAASAVTFVDSGTLTATITAKGGGPRGSHVWDVRVTNPDGSTGVLPGGFTVTK